MLPARSLVSPRSQRSAIAGDGLAKMGAVSKALVVHLDALDDRLLAYLDKDEELHLDTVMRLRFYTTALFDGSITPHAVVEDWADWFDLAPAFVAAYAPEWMEELEAAATFLDGPKVGGDPSLAKADRVYLLALESLLDAYRALRTLEE